MTTTYEQALTTLLNYMIENHKALFQTFAIVNGRKYDKIVRQYDAGGQSVYCFVEKSTGKIFKPASWNAPAKHARGSIYESFEGCCGKYGVASLRGW